MARIDARSKGGPTGRARVSLALMRRPQGDPREHRNANILATNARTARGLEFLDLGLDEAPPPMIDEQLRRIQDWARELQSNMIQRELLEKGP